MVKTKVYLLLASLLFVWGCSATKQEVFLETNQEKIQRTLEGIFEEVSKNKLENRSPLLKTFTVNGKDISSVLDETRTSILTLCDFTLELDAEKVRVSGYVDGLVSLAGGESIHGPWRLTGQAVETSGGWNFSFISLLTFPVVDLEYLVQVPDSYSKDDTKKWPLIVFLHGAGERGGTLEKLKQLDHSMPFVAETRENFPFVVVSPLCPARFSWYELAFSVNKIIDEVLAEHAIDSKRIYLTGISLGGMGTWSLALQFPTKFAAIAPVSASVDPDKVYKLQNLPIWAFHGALDTIVLKDMEFEAVQRLKARKADIKYTLYPDVEHNAWDKAYSGTSLFTWFLKHSLKEIN